MHNAPISLILTQARFTTLDPSTADPEAVAIAAGRFAAVGDLDDLLGEAGPTTRILDLGGRRVIPGPIPGPIDLLWAAMGVAPGRSANKPEAWEALARLVSGDDRESRTQALRSWFKGCGQPWADADPRRAIQVGRWANLTVLSDDVMTAPRDRIAHIRADLIVENGAVIYGAGPFASLARDFARPGLTPSTRPGESDRRRP